MNLSKQRARELLDPATASIFYLATFFGLVAGLGQVLAFAFEKFVLHDYIHQSPDVVIEPLASVLFPFLTGLVFWLVARRWPRIMPWWLLVFAFAFLYYFSMLLMASWLIGISRAILATGLAVETTRVIGDHQKGFRSLVRYSAGWIGLLRMSKKTEQHESVAHVSTGYTIG